MYWSEFGTKTINESIVIARTKIHKLKYTKYVGLVLPNLCRYRYIMLVGPLEFS